jgi:hypothetical protein
VAVWFGFNVSGKVAPDVEKPAPVRVAELMVTAAVPVEERVMVCDVEVFTGTLPKLRFDVLTASVGTAAFNCRAKVCVTAPADAESVTVCAVDTAEAVAEKLAPVAPAATVTVASTVTPVLLLERLTLIPPVAAAAFNVTVQATVPAPVMDEFAQDRAVRTGTPAPERLIVVDAPVEELLESVSEPVVAPAAAGSN